MSNFAGNLVQMQQKDAKFTEILLEMPSLGGKCWVLDQKGIFLLERGPGTLRTIACTHAGSGTLRLLDGVPDENGSFDFHEIENLNFQGNGRQLYKANPIVMGSWMLDAGFQNGLTLINAGGQMGVSAIASVVWVPYRRRGV